MTLASERAVVQNAYSDDVVHPFRFSLSTKRARRHWQYHYTPVDGMRPIERVFLCDSPTRLRR